MTSSNRRFFEHFNKPISDIYIQYKISGVQNEKDIDYFCFVEGSTDEKFYNSISHEFFRVNNVRYIYMGYYDGNKENEGYRGKEAVILATKVVKHNYKKLLKKFIFIVDHDNFGIEEYKKGIEENYLNMLTVLPVYSFENYYFYKNNLSKGLSNYLSNIQIEDLESRLNLFCDEIIDYFALKATKTAAHILPKYKKNGSLVNYRHKSKDKNIFVFEFSSEEHYRKDLLENEVFHLKQIVNEDATTINLYKMIKTKMSTGKDFIKGKILFHYMSDYLEYHYKINLKYGDDNYKINRLLEIDLEIKLPDTKF